MSVLTDESTQVEPPCTAATKYCRVLIAATEQFDGVGPDPEIVSAVAVHESGRTGSVGFGIVDGHGGYLAHNDTAASVHEFLGLVSGGRYAEAWDARGDDVVFLHRIVAAGYAEDKAWAGKILWFRQYLNEHERWEGGDRR